MRVKTFEIIITVSTNRVAALGLLHAVAISREYRVYGLDASPVNQKAYGLGRKWEVKGFWDRAMRAISPGR